MNSGFCPPPLLSLCLSLFFFILVISLRAKLVSDGNKY